jgi:hypothetical protein
MMNVSTIRAVVRAKFVKPDITVREQAAIAGASPSATHRLNKRCQKMGSATYRESCQTWLLNM